MPDLDQSLFDRQAGRSITTWAAPTFSNYTVLPEIALARSARRAFRQGLLPSGCGVTTGIGAVINTAKVEAGANVSCSARRHRPQRDPGRATGRREQDIGVDVNPRRKPLAEQFWHDALRENPQEVEGDLVPHLVRSPTGGADYSFECVGNVELIARRSSAATAAGRVGDHRRRPGRQEIKTRPFQL